MTDETRQRDRSTTLEEPAARRDGAPLAAGPHATPATAADPVPAAAPAAAAERPSTEPATVWPAETARGFRDQWRDIQLRFVDDPQGATSDAEALLAEVLDAFAKTLAAHKSEVDTWGDAEGADVERLRTAVRRYRDLLERLLGM